MATRPDHPTQRAVRDYWDTHIHDLDITTHPPGSAGFFADLEQYHSAASSAAARAVRPVSRPPRARSRLRRRTLDSIRETRRKGHGVDLAPSSIALAARNFELERLPARLVVADGEALPFSERSFDLVYAHGVVQYTTDDRALVRECRRVLRPGGMAVFQVYNRVSWLNALSKVTKGGPRTRRAPMLKKYSIGEFGIC